MWGEDEMFYFKPLGFVIWDKLIAYKSVGPHHFNNSNTTYENCMHSYQKLFYKTNLHVIVQFALIVKKIW